MHIRHYLECDIAENINIRHYLECDIANRIHKLAYTTLFGMWYCKQRTYTCTYDIIWNVILQTENINLHIRHYLKCDIANREHKLAHTTLFGMWYCKRKTLTCIYDIIWNVILQTENINLHIRHYFECDIANRKQKPAHIWNVKLQTENRNLHIFGIWYCKQKTYEFAYTTLFGMWYCKQKT